MVNRRDASKAPSPTRASRTRHSQEQVEDLRCLLRTYLRSPRFKFCPRTLSVPKLHSLRDRFGGVALISPLSAWALLVRSNRNPLLEAAPFFLRSRCAVV